MLYNSNGSIQHQSFVCTQLNGLSVPFYPNMGPYQVLPLRIRVDLGVMVMKRYFTIPETPWHPMIKCHIWDNHGSGSYASAVLESAYSTVHPTELLYKEICGVAGNGRGDPCDTMLVTVPNIKSAALWHHLEHQ